MEPLDLSVVQLTALFDTTSKAKANVDYQNALKANSVAQRITSI